MLRREKSVKKIFDRPKPKESLPEPTPTPTPVQVPPPSPEPILIPMEPYVVSVRPIREEIDELKIMVEKYIRKTDERFDKLAQLLVGRSV